MFFRITYDFSACPQGARVETAHLDLDLFDGPPAGVRRRRRAVLLTLTDDRADFFL
jgi:hypothetical protein